MASTASERLARLMPRSAHKTNDIYAASETLLNPANDSIAADHDDKIVFINDDLQLQHFVERCRRADNVAKHAERRGFVENVLNASSFSVPFYKLDLAKWSLENKVTPTGLTDLDFVILREDSLTDLHVGEFLELYSQTPPLTQPRVAFVPNAAESDLARRLCYANPNIQVVNLGDAQGSALPVPRATPRSLIDFASLYESGCFEIASKTTSSDIKAWSSASSQLSELALLITRARAKLLTVERHIVERDVDALLHRLSTMMDDVTDGNIEPLLYLKTIVLLQKLFCSENSIYLSEAISLTSALGDEFGLATCLRFAEFLEVHPALIEHMYRKAERTFRSYGALELAIYSKSNRLTSSFTRQIVDGSEFGDLLQEIRSERPGLHRRHDIFYNSAVRELLCGRIPAAFAIFDDWELLSARPLVVASAMLGRLICRRIMGERIDAESVNELVTYVLDVVPRGNRWHVTNLLLNLLVALRDDRDLTGAVRNAAAGRLETDGVMDVRDRFEENKRLANVVGLSNNADLPRIPGRFGDFQDRHGFAVPFYFIWS